MTDINKSKNQRIDSLEAAEALFLPLAPDAAGKIGLEVEMNLYRADGEQIVIPPADAMQRMQKSLIEKGFDAQLEAAGVLEYASPAVPVADVASLMPRVARDIRCFTRVAKKEGYTRSPFCVLPTATVAQAMDNLVSRERLQAALTAIPNIYGHEALKIPLLTTGVQVSFSPADADQMYRMARRAYMLTPLLLACMNSNAGFIEDNPTPYRKHARASYYAAHKRAGGLAESFARAHDGTSFIREHVKMVFDIPMFFAYDLEGKILQAKAGEGPLTFRKLIEMGLNTQSNFELAESFLYNDVKICNLRDNTGEVIGKRLEVRAGDGGMHQPDHMLLLTSALVPDGETAKGFEALWIKYGFSGQSAKDASLLQASRDAAVNHNGHFMDVPFGTGKLTEFAAEVATLIERHHAQTPTVALASARLCRLLRSGDCDAHRYAKRLTALSDVKKYLIKRAG